jgi:LemA protein
MASFLIALAVIGAAILMVTVFFVSVYNNLVQIRNNVDKAWNNIDVILLQRNEELTKLIDTCRAYMKHEVDLLEKITEMRTRYGLEKELAAKTEIENQLQASMGQLRSVWEGYPQLRATENFQQVQTRISALESTIADRREFFNDSVNIYNVRIESIPDLFLATLLGYARKPFLAVPEEKKADVKMDFHSQAVQQTT